MRVSNEDLGCTPKLLNPSSMVCTPDCENKCFISLYQSSATCLLLQLYSDPVAVYFLKNFSKQVIWNCKNKKPKKKKEKMRKVAIDRRAWLSWWLPGPFIDFCHLHARENSWSCNPQRTWSHLLLIIQFASSPKFHQRSNLGNYNFASVNLLQYSCIEFKIVKSKIQTHPRYAPCLKLHSNTTTSIAEWAHHWLQMESIHQDQWRAK